MSWLKERGKKLKCIRADNGGEYRGPFEKYCKDYGIKLQKTVPKTPQENGVAERMNRTIVERIRCMLSHAKLPKLFWGEAMRTAVDLINLSPSAPLDGDVPERVWTGKDVSYSHLKVFGCKTFVHIPKDERSKLDGKSKECIFLGYGHEEFGYRLWDPKDKKVIRSRDVVFFEDQLTEDFGKQEKPKYLNSSPINLDPVPPPMVHDDDREDVQDDSEHDDTGASEGSTGDNGHSEASEHGELSSQSKMTEPEVKRSNRQHRASSRYPASEYVFLTDEGEPECIQEVQNHKDKDKWFQAMQEEMKSLYENHTFDLVKLPKGKRPLKKNGYTD